MVVSQMPYNQFAILADGIIVAHLIINFVTIDEPRELVNIFCKCIGHEARRFGGFKFHGDWRFGGIKGS